MPGHNDHNTINHWKQELRNCLYQLTDNELVNFLRMYFPENERLRVCIRIADEDLDKDEKETAAKD